MRKSRLKPISDKQEIEIAKRRALKYELWLEQEGQCKDCGRYMNYRVRTAANYPELSHKKLLSDGGKTDKKNCSVICAEHHANEEHHLRQIYNEQPMWRKRDKSS